MKMFMIIVEDALRDRVEVFLEQHQAKGYTEIPMVYGEGGHGKRLGSRLHPGASSIIFTIVPADRVEALKADLRGLTAEVESKHRSMHVAVVHVEEFL